MGMLSIGFKLICDRFIDSTFAYQVFGKKVNPKFIEFIHKYILNNNKPDITFVLKANISQAMKRLNKRKVKNRYDKFSKNFYTKVQKAFLKIASLNKKRCLVVDNSKNNPDAEEIIFKNVARLLK